MSMKTINMESITEYYKEHKSNPIGTYRFFSVLIPFVETEDEVHILLELRARDMEDAPGEICFPGGGMEEDEDPVMTALRETDEELGIPKERIRILGIGDTLYSFSGLAIHTIPGIVSYDTFLNIKANPKEVEEAFLVPLSFFAENEPLVIRSKLEAERSDFPWDLAGIDESYPWSTGIAEVPIYKPLPDGKIVWGMTANIIRHMIKDLSRYGI